MWKRTALRLITLACVAAWTVPGPGQASSDAKGRRMKIDIRLAPAGAAPRQVGRVAVLPLAAGAEFSVRFANAGDGDLVIDSPDTSQELLLWLAALAQGEPVAFLLNPSHMDSQGEMTAPLPAQLRLAPRQFAERTVALQRYNLDRWFEPGVYEVWIEFQGARSERLRFATELQAESVPRLAELALAGPDAWVREQAMLQLAKVPGAPAAVPPSGDTAAYQGALERYAGALRRFTADWARLRQTAEVTAFFARVRAETWLPR